MRGKVRGMSPLKKAQLWAVLGLGAASGLLAVQAAPWPFAIRVGLGAVTGVLYGAGLMSFSKAAVLRDRERRQAEHRPR